MTIQTELHRKPATAFAAAIEPAVPTALNKGKREPVHRKGRPWAGKKP